MQNPGHLPHLIIKYLIFISVIVGCLLGFFNEAQAQLVSSYRKNAFYNPYKPKTPSEIRHSYSRYVIRADGISKYEARIIVQYHILRQSLDFRYDLRKPKVVDESENSWVVQMPAKFSLSGNQLDPYTVNVSKQDGRLTE